MTPFSPIYFIKENKKKCILLIFMIFLSYGVYLGGLYVSNAFDNWKLSLEYSDKMLIVKQAASDKNGHEFQLFKEKILKDDKVKAMPVASYNGFSLESIMGFTMDTLDLTFSTVDDFKAYCDYMGIECDFLKLNDGSAVMSSRFAANAGLKKGDKIDSDIKNENHVFGEYTLDFITNEDGYLLYFINKDLPNQILIFSDKMENKELFDYVCKYQNSYNVHIKENLRDRLEGQLGVFNILYMFIVMLISLIMSVTINAAFIGMYQRRHFEFAVYRAIGISKQRIIAKISGELLCMDIIGITVGGIVAFTSLYLLNHMVLYPVGKYLRYFHPVALAGLLFCNVMIIIPLIFTRSRKLLKADICEY
ncbi:MAG: ABC transporter permease [Lachnospiraceae bacterium]|nr:ABC transporter permease [Lachnospiraceae bacterium]